MVDKLSLFFRKVIIEREHLALFILHSLACPLKPAYNQVVTFAEHCDSIIRNTNNIPSNEVMKYSSMALFACVYQHLPGNEVSALDLIFRFGI